MAKKTTVSEMDTPPPDVKLDEPVSNEVIAVPFTMDIPTAAEWLGFKISTLRNYVYYADDNGLSDYQAIARIGRHVRIIIPRFIKWLDSKPPLLTKRQPDKPFYIDRLKPKSQRRMSRTIASG